MLIDVLFYADIDNPLGYPTAWPAQVIEQSSPSAPVCPPWRRMTLAEYKAHISDPWLLATASKISKRVKETRQ